MILRAKTVFREKRAKVVIQRAFLVKLEGINRFISVEGKSSGLEGIFSEIRGHFK